MFEGGLGQSLLYPLTEIGDGLGQAKQFLLPISLYGERVGLRIQSGNSLLQFRAAALVFDERNDSTEVCFCQSIQLLLDLDTRAPQIFLARLEFLWQPASTLGTLQSLCDARGVPQNFA